MKKLNTILLILACSFSYGQGFNHQWLLGSFNLLQDPKGRAFIDGSNFNVVQEFRKMVFKGSQGNICDANGNFLMSSNGVWIADATNDTMMNGNGLNPSVYVNNYPNGLPIPHANVFLPYPNDSSRYTLFHHTVDSLGGGHLFPLKLYYSNIDMNMNGGLGAVSLKNAVAFQDTLSWGIGACKHANGADWWVVMMKDRSDKVHKALLTASGVADIGIQSLGYAPLPADNTSQLTFSPDGSKFIATTYDNVSSQNSFLVISDFDRCSGNFSNTQTLNLVTGDYLWGLAFSATGNYIYACSNQYIFQVDATTLSIDTVAIYDGFISPPASACCATTFFNMYLAADGKIYVSSGSSVRHITVINEPDSLGLACDVQQHAIDLQTYYYLSAVPNHPNYYLSCDTTQTTCPCLITDINGLSPPDFKFRIYPNPVSNEVLNIGYLLPQNKSGVFEMMDVTGKVVFRYTLPPWSNEQGFKLPALSNGVYNCVIRSDGKRVSKKVAVINE